MCEPSALNASLPYGSLAFPTPVAAGATGDVVCDAGAVLSGPASFACAEDGSWEPSSFDSLCKGQICWVP